jgi:MoaD family protein
VRVQLYATLRAAAGRKTVEVDHPDGATVHALVATLVHELPELAPLVLDEQGKLLRSVHVYVNGRSAIHLPERLESPLSADDVVDVMPAVAGG